jgi:radical SAM protein with 4Fe4S-binding SPASM domain
MIDYISLEKAYDNDGFYSLQLEVGDKCHQGCTYCYMNAVEETRNELTEDILQGVLEDARELGITAIEWLGGEPLIRPGIFPLMEHAKRLGLKNNMWTGGLPFKDDDVVKKTAELCENGLISIHLSTLDPPLYKKLHPHQPEDDIQIILNGIKKLLDLGYPADQLLNSVTFTGLQPSEDLIHTMEFFYSEFGIQTSINVYHTYLRPGSGKSELNSFIPRKEEVSKIYNKYKKILDVSNLPMNCVDKKYCSTTIALLNNGFVTPCATIREEDANRNVKSYSFKSIVEHHRDYLSFKLLKATKNLPEGCGRCNMHDNCWGCRSRSYAIGDGMYGKDPRCFRSANIM